MFPFIIRPRHSCTPIPVEGEVRIKRAQHSEHKAGYEIVEYSYKKAECPICNEIFTYDGSKTDSIEFIPYKEIK